MKVKIEAWDYNKCADKIEEVLGYKLRDTLGKHGKSESKEVEYRDFWHFIGDNCEPHNGSIICIGSELKDGAKNWQKEIIDAFVEQFGDDQEYWVEW